MFTILECVTVQHDGTIVALSAGIALLGMLSFFHLLLRAEESTANRRRSWIAVAALTAGSSIWATHFVAMLAYKGPLPIGFDLPFTGLSAVVAAAGAWCALRIEGDGSGSTFLRALVLTLSVATMHFLGMAGMQVAAYLRYEAVPVAAGTASALGLFFLALYVFPRLRGTPRIVLPAFLGILAVCALHFTAMSATILTPDPSIAGPDAGGIGRIWLMAAVAGVIFLILAAAGVAALIDRHLVDLAGFADATLDGLAIVRDGRIREVNARFAALLEQPEAALVGADANRLIAARDGLPAHMPRPAAIEATPLSGDTARIFELAVHTIEYRGRPSEVIAIRDLTEKRAAQRKVEYLARHDMLTGLANRVAFQERLDLQLSANRKDGTPFAVLALDLDRFKTVNDLFGHAEGDRVLREVAAILTGCAGAGDAVARLGGDEFTIVMPSGSGAGDAEQLAETILAAFREKMDASVEPTAVGVSIGLALFPRDGMDGETLMHAADVALYRAKTNGRGMLAFYDLAMDQETKARRQLEADLRMAIGNDELHVLYQPVLSSDQGKVVGYEALLRWHHPVRGEVSPEQFIPLAEETGIILTLGEWVLQQACRTASGWSPDIRIAVNISPVQFRLANLAFVVCRILEETGLSPTRLELEITETALLKDRDATLNTLEQLKALGVSIVMDDFGTGYSSLSNLRSFPFDKIKIDRSFIAAMNEDENARAIVKAVVGLGRSLDLPVTAEGIETEDQYRMVMNEGCAQMQGFFIGRPQADPAQDIRPIRQRR